MIKDSLREFRQSSVVLILAAGRAQRFGKDKRNAVVGSGKTLLEQSISQYRLSGLRVVVALSADTRDDLIAKRLNVQSIECLRCRRAAEGMGGTLAESVEKIGTHCFTLVALADMPGVAAETIELLQENAHRERIVFPVYRGRRGHPVIFGERYLPLLKSLSGDSGASELIKKHATYCIPVAVSDPGTVMDVDTPADLPVVQQILQARSS